MAGTLGPLARGRPRGDLVAAVTAALAEVAEAATVVVAVSGGSDSTALAYLVAEARDDLDLHLVNVRHGLRDDTAEQEVLDVHAAYLGLPLRRVEVDVAPAGEGIEAAARQARYTALAAAATEVGATLVLVGHTADDQAETVLLRAARGTGTDGLGAMPRRRDLDRRIGLFRPLLGLRRTSLRDFLAAEGLPFVDDPTNTDPQVRRSVVRNVVLPALDQVGGDPVGALARLADLSRADAEALDDMAATEMATMVVRVGPIRCLPDARLALLPLALRRRVVRAVLAELLERPLGADAVDRVLALASGAAVDLAGDVRATAGGGWRTIGPPAVQDTPTTALTVPGEVVWPTIGARIVAITPQTDLSQDLAAGQIAFQLAEAWTPPAVRVPGHLVPPGGTSARMSLALGADHGRLEVRSRRPGDRVRTGGGTRRLQDVLIDAGLPRPVRDLWPIVADGSRVVWVPGIAADVETVRDGRAAPRALLVVQSAV
ncbi:MAG: tRNA lysidine(34) synthetase TilS [Actinobacteria bacterium]|nr:tRNA lysidine(34) synthetase TilS [Actinomycetota bacterium]